MGRAVVVCIGVVANLFCSQHSFASSILFSLDGKAVRAVTSDDLARMLPLVEIKIQSPENGQQINYEGYLFTDVLKTLLGSEWTRYGTIEFGCSDGYRPTMKTAVALRHQGLIALRQSGKTSLPPLQRTNGSVVDLGKFYLVWENIHDSSAAKSTDLSWPWQLESISLIK